MNKLLICIFSQLLIGCYSETDLPNNGLYGDIKMLTEYNVGVKYDSINKPIRDTLSIVTRFYTENNQIVEHNEEYTYLVETMNIKYEYNSCNRLIKEQVKMSFDSNAVDVNYFYKGALLDKTITKSSRDSMTFYQKGLFHYNSDKNLIKSSVSQLFIDLKTGDTIKNSMQIDNYDDSGSVTDSRMKYQTKQSENSRTEYIYNEKDLIKSLEFNQNDSLIATYRFEYKKDNLNNWIERKAFKNNNLNNIKTWIIVYK